MRDLDKALAEIVEDAEAHTMNGHGGKREQGSMTTLPGRGADYLARRIARNRPDILERMKAGKYTSVRAAAKAKVQQGTRTDLLLNSTKGSEPVHTRDEVAKIAGVSPDTIRKAKVIDHEADEPTKEALRKGERSIHRVYQELRSHPRTLTEIPQTPGDASSRHLMQKSFLPDETYTLESDAPQDGDEWENTLDTFEDLMDNFAVMLEGIRAQGGIREFFRYPSRFRHPLCLDHCRLFIEHRIAQVCHVR